MNNRNLRNLVFKQEHSKLGKLLNKLRKEGIVFFIRSGMTGSSIQSEMDKIVSGGKVEVIGKLKRTHNQFQWTPPEKYTLYHLGTSKDGMKLYIMLRSNKGKEIISVVYLDGSVEEGNSLKDLIFTIRKEIGLVK